MVCSKCKTKRVFERGERLLESDGQKEPCHDCDIWQQEFIGSGDGIEDRGVVNNY